MIIYSRLSIDDLRPTGQRIANEIEKLLLKGTGAKVIQLPVAANN